MEMQRDFLIFLSLALIKAPGLKLDHAWVCDYLLHMEILKVL